MWGRWVAGSQGQRPAPWPCRRGSGGPGRLGGVKGSQGGCSGAINPPPYPPNHPQSAFTLAFCGRGAKEGLRGDFSVGRHPLPTSSLVGPAQLPLCSHIRRLSGVRGDILQAQVLLWMRRPGVGRGEKDRRSRDPALTLRGQARSAAGRTRRPGQGLRSARLGSAGREDIHSKQGLWFGACLSGAKDAPRPDPPPIPNPIPRSRLKFVARCLFGARVKLGKRRKGGLSEGCPCPWWTRAEGTLHLVSVRSFEK